MSSNRKMYFFFCSKPTQTNRIKKKQKSSLMTKTSQLQFNHLWLLPTKVDNHHKASDLLKSIIIVDESKCPEN